MWGLTRQEQRVILFLLTTFAIGCGVLWWRQQRPAPAIPPGVLQKFAERSTLLVRDSLAVAAPPLEENRIPISPASPVDINRATLRELTELPGIGVVMAQRIVDYRSAHGRFSNRDDLMNVKGIGKKTFERLAPLIVAK